MSKIPDCRNGEYYNEKFLDDLDREFVRGYDYCMENVVMTFFDNIDIYYKAFDEADKVINVAKLIMNNESLDNAFRKCISHYAVMQKNELITGMIDGTAEKTYEEMRKKHGYSESEN